MAAVDVVVVSYNNRAHLRDCVEPLTRIEDVRVIVVDNRSTDGALETIADLPVTAISRDENGGFAVGCNVGWRAGDAPYVLFLNPDARLEARSLRLLASTLESNPRVGAVAPRVTHEDGSLDFSQRRYPRLRSTYAQALYLHRLFPQASWSDEVVRSEDAYRRPAAPEWVSGACLLVRRSALEQLDGFDERFFLYCEDKDLCRRLWATGWKLRFDPVATCTHRGGASMPRSSLLPVLAASRIAFARKHRGTVAALLEQMGIALWALNRVVVSRHGFAGRLGHARSLASAIRTRGTRDGKNLPASSSR